MRKIAGDNQAYYCDCCDPSRQKKRQYSSDEEEEDNEDEDELEQEAEDETSSSVDSKAEKTENNTPKQTTQPGWFGKGRRKKARC